MSRYAEGTGVDIGRSRIDIERVIMRYGCGQFVTGSDSAGRALIGFTAHGRQVRITVDPPDPKDFARSPKGRARKPSQIQEVVAQETRRRWRTLLLVLKAKLDACESGITTFEAEFLSYTVLPNGRTVGESVAPMLAEAYSTGRVPLLLPAFAGGSSD